MDHCGVGISLGSETCAVAVTNNSGRHEVVANGSGHRTTPTYLSFVNGEILMGSGAKNAFVQHPTKSVPYLMPLCSVNIVNDGNFRPKCDVKVCELENGNQVIFPTVDATGFLPANPEIPKVEEGQGLPHSAAELLTEYLKLLKADIVDGAVNKRRIGCLCVTVPRYMDSCTDTIKAAVEASKIGQSVRVVHDDVCGIIGSNLFGSGANNTRGVSTDITKMGAPASHGDVIVVDWGANVLSISIIRVRGGVFIPLADCHYYNSGATAVDKQLAKGLCNVFKRKTKMDASEDGRSMRKLFLALEDARKTLSVSQMASVNIEAFFEGIDLKDTLSSVKLETAIREVGHVEKLRTGLADVVEKATSNLVDSGDEALSISNIVSQGGFCTTPFVQKVIKQEIEALVSKKNIAEQDAIIFSPISASDEICAAGACAEAFLSTESYMMMEIDRQRITGMPTTDDFSVMKTRGVDVDVDEVHDSLEGALSIYIGKSGPFSTVAEPIGAGSIKTALVDANVTEKRADEIAQGLGSGAYRIPVSSVLDIAHVGAVLPFRSCPVNVKRGMALVPLITLASTKDIAVVSPMVDKPHKFEEDATVTFRLYSENNGGTFILDVVNSKHDKLFTAKV